MNNQTKYLMKSIATRREAGWAWADVKMDWLVVQGQVKLGLSWNAVRRLFKEYEEAR